MSEKNEYISRDEDCIKGLLDISIFDTGKQKILNLVDEINSLAPDKAVKRISEIIDNLLKRQIIGIDSSSGRISAEWQADVVENLIDTDGYRQLSEGRGISFYDGKNADRCFKLEPMKPNCSNYIRASLQLALHEIKKTLPSKIKGDEEFVKTINL